MGKLINDVDQLLLITVVAQIAQCYTQPAVLPPNVQQQTRAVPR